MKKYKIDYDQYKNCFKKNEHVQTQLIYGSKESFLNPFISYIIPVYKRADLLEKTLISVLNQQPVGFNWDVVIVDNEAGGCNNTERLIRRINNPRILYYRNQENIGVDGNYNRCIEVARGEWVAMVHGDDLILSDHLRKSATYIYELTYEKNKQPLAYICQRYIDFTDECEVILERPNGNAGRGKYDLNRMLTQVYTHGKPALQPRYMGIMTGFYAALPSFGTIMNREIMLKEGGFNEELGICEDVVTPFKLAKKYGVYMAPVVMGYHRFDGNESMKHSTIKKIYASMIDFREYMYSTVWWGEVWGCLARDIFNKNLRDYCIGQSRFSSKKLLEKDFDDIYIPQKVSNIKMIVFNSVISFFYRLFDLDDFDVMINDLIDFRYKTIEEAVIGGSPVLLYGAGKAAQSLIPILKERFPGINIIGCAVTKATAESKIKGITIKPIHEYIAKKNDVIVITTTILWQYQDEMNELLDKLEFKSRVNLLV